ncbi:peptidase C15, pyroglutamyl peptidase I-like protein [Gloeophyllum trabeum ATCC 11539]|uniref:Peptidase C15, pyroglutamyl peptidase I-like protein n=1 Tax=Gloeophyllum trabeum (strain ATCC 11539 / FP-39264 / Madison 617) TaxID=670483 RepID=S7Q2R9_GLOTA|nr:peptidase C15, pyroglutamyl peptidase I-like protein [Gloeophyllum trabeum ATCC 11539]EPQ54291.1 peptidase C15, pyroglutamyl peptidase I-like protein [Gloeophyllum trabeum ATCC 11539]
MASFDNNPYRVLLTGFGPFGRFRENPSWLAVKPLHNTVMEADGYEYSSPIIHDDHSAMIVDEDGPRPRQIHITSLLIPMEYGAALAIVPPIHATPPMLPRHGNDSLPFIAPPEDGYDFVLHVGVAGRGPLRMEKVGHKLGYRLKDATGAMAPVVAQESLVAREITEAERREMDRLTILNDRVGNRPPSEVVDPMGPLRGFGKGYENFDDDLYTEIDVEKLVVHLKETGIEQVYTSMDAGHYLCDFVYFCSLAESRRGASNRRGPDPEMQDVTKVLGLQIPPVGQPLSTEEVTEAIRRIILWVCRTG